MSSSRWPFYAVCSLKSLLDPLPVPFPKSLGFASNRGPATYTSIAVDSTSANRIKLFVKLSFMLKSLLRTRAERCYSSFKHLRVRKFSIVVALNVGKSPPLLRPYHPFTFGDVLYYIQTRVLMSSSKPLIYSDGTFLLVILPHPQIQGPGLLQRLSLSQNT